MPTNKKSRSFKEKSITISGDVRDSNVFIGDNYTVSQTIIQKFFNIFKSDTENCVDLIFLRRVGGGYHRPPPVDGTLR
jgi:hypothetical protein